MHPTMLDFLRRMEAADKMESARSYAKALRQYSVWLESRSLDPLKVTAENLTAFQVHLSEYKKEDGEPLAPTTQRTRMAEVLGYYRFLERRGLIVGNPARKIRLSKMSIRSTPKDYLELQEATALVQTQAKRILEHSEGSYLRAIENRNLVMVCIALATGRRSSSLCSLKTEWLDTRRNELRIEREKGVVGRVLPVAGWAIDVSKMYLKESRPRLLVGRLDEDWLFPGNRNQHVAPVSFAAGLQRLFKQTVEENPDLEDLAEKRISPHCLRVSFATLLFTNGCNIRSVNELMLHRKLSTTARYTPIPLDDLRRVCRRAHPRA